MREQMAVVTGHLLFALCMEIYTTNCSFDLVEAYIVKPLKACPSYGPYPVIRDQEMLLPPHEYVFPLYHTRNGKTLFCLLLERSESREFCPVLKIYLIRRSPILVLGEKGVLWANYFSFKICCKSWMVFC